MTVSQSPSEPPEELVTYVREQHQRSMAPLYTVATLLTALSLILPTVAQQLVGADYQDSHRSLHLSASAALIFFGLWSRTRLIMIGNEPLAGVALNGILNITLFLTLVVAPLPNAVWPICFLIIGTALLYPRYIWMGLTLALQIGGFAYALATSALPFGEWAPAVVQFFSALIMCAVIFAYQRRGLRQLVDSRATSLLAQQQLNIEMYEKSSLQERAHVNRQLAALSRFGGGLLHDFNNILMPVMGNASLLRDTELSSSQRLRVNQILEAAEQAAALSRQVGALVGPGGSRAEEIDLAATVEELVRTIWRALPAGANVTLTPYPEPLWLNANKAQLQRVLTGLLISLVERHQALQAGQESSTNPESISRSTSTLTLSLHKPNAAKECRLEIFVTSQSGRTVVDSVAKLGADLSYAHTGLEALGGRLEFTAPPNDSWQSYEQLTQPDNTPEPNKDTEASINGYLVVLPLQGTDAGLSSQNAPQVVNDPITRGHGQLILVVDDEANLREISSSMLKRAGYRTTTAASGKEAIAACKSAAPDLIIMDMRMPEMNGRETIEAIREQLPEVPVVVCTGYDNQSMNWINQQSRMRLLTKPFTSSGLLAAVGLLS